MKSFAVFWTHVRFAAFSAAIAAMTLLAAGSSAAQDADFAIDGARTLSVVSTTAAAGSQVNVAIELDSQGDETTISFSLAYDRFLFTNPVVTLGSGAPAGATVSVNSSETGQGRLGIVIEGTEAFAVSPPNRQVVSIRFNVSPNAPQFTTPINFVSTPTPQSVANLVGALLPTNYETGAVTLTAAVPVTISGRVTSPTGQNLRNIVVSLIDARGIRRVATTSSFGIYTFNNVTAGQEYTVIAAAKRYRFGPRTITPTGNVTNLDLTGLE